MNVACDGIRCRLRDKCKNYIHNFTDGIYQDIDWSRYGWGGVSTDQDGKVSCNQGWYCGDLSDDYQYFKNIDF